MFFIFHFYFSSYIYCLFPCSTTYSLKGYDSYDRPATTPLHNLSQPVTTCHLSQPKKDFATAVTTCHNLFLKKTQREKYAEKRF